MTVWVDADACPGPIKEIVVRAALRLKVRATFVANSNVSLPVSPLLVTVRVAKGLDEADRYVTRAAAKGDLAVTADIPLAAALVAKKVTVIDPRGTVYTEENVTEALAVRNFMSELRESGVETSGPRSFSPRDTKSFASAFDRELAAALRRQGTSSKA